MRLLRKILGYRDFVKINAIIQYLIEKRYINYVSAQNLKVLNLFQTSRQKTWLISSEQHVFCFLDDTTKNSIEFRWKENKEDLKNIITIQPDFKENTGIIDFGDSHKRWYYSKKLFVSEEGLRTKLADILE